VTNPLTKLAKATAGALLRRVLTSKVRAAAEGKLGKTPDERAAYRARYWWLVGKKTGTGVVLLALTAALGAYPETNAWAPYIAGPLAVLLIEWGLLDKAWRSYRPAFLDSTWARVLAAHTAEAGTVFTAAFTWQMTGCDGAWCSYVGGLLLALAALAVQYGFLDAAWKAPAPHEIKGRQETR
jgi:hypothetical protein